MASPTLFSVPLSRALEQIWIFSAAFRPYGAKQASASAFSGDPSAAPPILGCAPAGPAARQAPRMAILSTDPNSLPGITYPSGWPASQGGHHYHNSPSTLN